MPMYKHLTGSWQTPGVAGQRRFSGTISPNQRDTNTYALAFPYRPVQRVPPGVRLIWQLPGHPAIILISPSTELNVPVASAIPMG